MRNLSKKLTYKMHREAYYKLFLGILIVSLISISIVSAQMEFDNIKGELEFGEGISNYGKVTIKDWFGLLSLTELELKNNTETCGRECSADLEIVMHQKGSLIDEVRFQGLINNERWIRKSFKDYELYVDDKLYNLGDEVEPGTYQVRLEGNKGIFETLDWQIVSQGKLIDVWALWGVTDISLYYAFNSTLESIDGVFNITVNEGSGIIYNSVGCLIGDCGNLTINENGVILKNDGLNVTENEGTFNIWFNASIQNEGTIFYWADDSRAFFAGDGGGVTLSSVGDTREIEIGTIVSTWQMLSFVFNTTGTSVYFNGIYNTSINLMNTTGDLYLGVKSAGTSDYLGKLDEMGFWNRSLTQDDITELWNNGAGIPFRSGEVSLDFPPSNFISPTNDVQFNCSADIFGITGLLNMSLLHNGSGTFEINQTNLVSGIVNETSFIANIAEATPTLWSCQAGDVDGNVFFAGQNRTVNTDTIDPEITIITPFGQVESFAFGDSLDLNWTITDLNLDSCWFEYNNVNTTLTCSDGNTTFIPVIGEQNLTVYANDSVNHLASNITLWTYAFLEQNVSFNQNVSETSSQDFELNLTTDIDILTITSFLVYNGTSDRSEVSCNSGGNCTLMNTIDIPLVSDALESENKSFFWTISIFNGTDSININTSSRIQNASKIHLEECGGDFNTTTLNFTAFNEQNLTIISPFLFDGDFLTWLGDGSVKRQTNISAGSVTSESLCLFPNATHFIDGQVTYDHPTPGQYTERNYWFQNDTISNISQDIELGLLLSTSSTSFILKVQDTNILPVSDVLIFTERFYPGEGEFRVVQVAKTDDNGGTIGFFETETADYRFILKQQAVTVLTTNDQKIVGETAPFTLTFTIGEAAGPAWEEFEDVDDLESSLTFNSSSNIVAFVYSDTSGEFFSGRLEVERIMSNGSENIMVCNTTSFQSSATMFCDLTGNESGTYSAQGIITRNSESLSTQILIQVLFGVNDFTDIAGDYGLFLGWFVILLSCFAFKFNEIAGIFMINVAVIGVNMIGLIHFGIVFISAMIALSIFIAVVLER